jgi:hypothetical protein
VNCLLRYGALLSIRSSTLSTFKRTLPTGLLPTTTEIISGSGRLPTTICAPFDRVVRLLEASRSWNPTTAGRAGRGDNGVPEGTGAGCESSGSPPPMNPIPKRAWLLFFPCAVMLMSKSPFVGTLSSRLTTIMFNPG